MWKEEKPIIPFNEINHLNVDNMKFVNGLRRSANHESQIDKFREAKRLDEEAAANNKLLKPTNCINTSCMSIGPDINATLIERSEILLAIQAATMALVQQSEYLEVIEAECDKASGIVLALGNQLEALEEKESVTLRKRLTKISLEKRDLLAQIAKMSRKLKYYQDKVPKTESVVEQQTQMIESERDPDKLYFEHFDATKKGPLKKHNGVFMVMEDGFRAWSCCNCPDEHSHGCIDDHSVTVRHSLGNMKRVFHNYTEYPIHPLVSTSSVVLRGHNAMVVERQSHNLGGHQRRPFSAHATVSTTNFNSSSILKSSPMKQSSTVLSNAKLLENSILHQSVSQSLDNLNQSSFFQSTLKQPSTVSRPQSGVASRSHSRPQSGIINSRPMSALSRTHSGGSGGGGAAAAHLLKKHKNSVSSVEQRLDLSKLPTQRGSWKIPIHTCKPLSFAPLVDPATLVDEEGVNEDNEDSPRLDTVTTPHTHHTYDTFLPPHASGGVLPEHCEVEVHAPQWVTAIGVHNDHVKDFNDTVLSGAVHHHLSHHSHHNHASSPQLHATTTSQVLHSPNNYNNNNNNRPKSGSLIGRVRIDPNREFTRKNRPMASPDGFALYMK